LILYSELQINYLKSFIIFSISFTLVSNADFYYYFCCVVFLEITFGLCYLFSGLVYALAYSLISGLHYFLTYFFALGMLVWGGVGETDGFFVYIFLSANYSNLLTKFITPILFSGSWFAVVLFLGIGGIPGVLLTIFPV